ncbi:MAG TPA: hypothetical protein VGC42_09645 [Kofleriaceae bacterium]
MSGALSLVLAQAAAAAPVWCKGAQPGNADLRDLSSREPREVIKALVAAECAPTAEVESRRGEVERARDAWSKRLGMTEADWADAVAYAQTSDDYSIAVDVASKTLAAASPLDQYATIMKTQETSSTAPITMDAFYATDMFESSLSEAARFAFLKTSCFDTGKRTVRDDAGMIGSEAYWAVCQADFDRFDLGKLLGEIHGDATHGGAAKMKLRILAYDFGKQVKEHAAAVGEAWKRDDANKKLFEIAAGARNEWTATLGKETRLLELALAMESATIAQSRKQLDGCGEATQAAVTQAISEIPAKQFAEMADQRGDARGKGVANFAAKAGPVLMARPRVLLAMIPFVLCDTKSSLSLYMQSLLDHGAGTRGPRNAALSKLRSTPVTYDNLNAKLTFPQPLPFSTHFRLEGGVEFRGDSRGGVVKSTKPEGDHLKVAVEKTTETFEDCVQSHQTNHISEWRADGTVRYEQHCDKSGMVTRDNTWQDIHVLSKYGAALRPGAMFSVLDDDVLAVWPSKQAKAPSMVLGAPVK